MKKLISLLLSVILLLSVFTVAASAAGKTDLSIKTYKDYKYTILKDGTVSIKKYTGKATDVSVPSAIKGNKVTEIGKGAFSYCYRVKTVTLPSGIKTIGDNAFSYCLALTKVNIKPGVKKIGKYAFLSSGITDIKLPDSITAIGKHAFAYCSSLSKINIPNMIKKIPSFLFDECTALKEIVIPDSVSVIEEGAFFCTAVSKVSLPPKLSVIEDYTFSGCDFLEEVDFPKTVTHIGESAFNGCPLRSLVLPEELLYIGGSAFAGEPEYKQSVLEKIVFNSKLRSIGSYAFARRSALKEIELPKSLRIIGEGAFASCKALRKISGGKGITQLGADIFKNTAFFSDENNWKDNELYFGNNLVAVSKASEGTYKIKDGTRVVANGIFNNLKGITEIYIPESVIGVASNEEGFRACCFNCPDLTKITVAKGNKKLTSVGGVLYNKNRTILYRYPAAKAQKSFTVPKSVKTVYTGAFSGCKNLTAVTFPNGSKAVVQSGSFDNCKKLTDVTFSKDVRIAIDAGFGHYKKANAQGVSKDIYIRNMKFKGYKSNKSLEDFLKCHCYTDNFTPLDKKVK